MFDDFSWNKWSELRLCGYTMCWCLFVYISIGIVLLNSPFTQLFTGKSPLLSSHGTNLLSISRSFFSISYTTCKIRFLKHVAKKQWNVSVWTFNMLFLKVEVIANRVFSFIFCTKTQKLIALFAFSPFSSLDWTWNVIWSSTKSKFSELVSEQYSVSCDWFIMTQNMIRLVVTMH